MSKENAKGETENDKVSLKKNIIALLIFGILIALVSIYGINFFHQNQVPKQEIDSQLNQANSLFNNSQFEKSIDGYNEVIKKSYNRFPYEYAEAQYKLGIAYMSLADVRDKEANAQKAINAYKEALKVHTIEKYPIQYAMTQNNIGNAYIDLADVRDKEANAQKAINAYKEALKVRTIEKYPIDYAMTQNNLGNAYMDLAKIKDKETNAQKAINAYKEALKVYTIEKYPIQYAKIQNNFGNAINSTRSTR